MIVPRRRRPPAPPTAVGPDHRPGPLSVTVVDDDPAYTRIVESALRLHGYATRPVQIAGPEASPVLLGSILLAHPDVVLLDLDLGPDLGDGTRLIAPLVRCGLRVVVVTGTADDQALGECLVHGASAVAMKGAGLSEVLDVLARLSDGRPPMVGPEKELLRRAFHRRLAERRA